MRAICSAFAVLLLWQPVEPPAISALVLDPNGKPVTSGTVALVSLSNARATARIDADGRFRITPDVTGRQSLVIASPDFAMYRANIMVPASRTLVLPDIQLLPPTYWRARFVTTDREPLGGTLRRRSLDADGLSITDPLDHVRERVENDGTVTLGPLPLGRTLLAFDRPGWAQVRLRDVNVNGSEPLIDAGTAAIDSGGTLQVDVVDVGGVAVAQHNVWLEDAMQPSPLFFSPIKTDAQGRAEFTRLAAGRYRVWTQTVERCGVQVLSVTRLVSTSGRGTSRARLMIGGRAQVRITSSLGPLAGKSITVSPDAPGETPWQPRFSAPMPRRAPSPRGSPGCRALTDADGRASMSPFPAGPADVRIPLINSTYLTRINVPESGREVVIEIPDGLIPVKVIDHDNRDPIGGARVLWTGGGSRVEAATNANGDALLEATGVTGGTLSLSANDYVTVEGAFAETPGILQEVSLTRSPSSRMMVRVVSSSGEPIAGAAVLLSSSRPGDPAEIAATDARGVAQLQDVPPGGLRITAAAQGFATGQHSIAAADRGPITLTLTAQ